MERLPLHPHDWHGTWNYTLRPEPLSPERPALSPEFGRFPVGDKAPVWLAHPGLTGLEPAAWADLVERYTRCRADHPPIIIPGRHRGGHTGTRLLSASDHLLVTVLKKRWSLQQATLATLLGVTKARIGAAVRETTPALEALGYTVTVGAITVTTPDQLAAIAGNTLPLA